MQSTRVAILGFLVGGTAAFFGRPQYDAWAKGRECCSTQHAPQVKSCPSRFEDGKSVVTDKAAALHLRSAMKDGVFAPWFELGRAPTPDEIGSRLHLDHPGV